MIVVDEATLAVTLTDGTIAAAGLDVFEAEPLPTDSPLTGLDDVIVSNHLAWYTEESSVELATKAACNISEVLSGGAAKGGGDSDHRNGVQEADQPAPRQDQNRTPLVRAREVEQPDLPAVQLAGHS